MERADQSPEGPVSLPSSELWGLKVYDTDGRLLGTVDSIARTVGGPVRAVVKSPDHPRGFAFVDISRGKVRNRVVLLPSAVGSPDADRQMRRSVPQTKLPYALAPRGAR